MGERRMSKGDRAVTRRQRIEEALFNAAAAPAENEQAWKAKVLDAVEAVINEWNREQIMEHASVDGWTLSTRNALMERLGC